jgi:hypothetical protein
MDTRVNNDQTPILDRPPGYANNILPILLPPRPHNTDTHPNTPSTWTLDQCCKNLHNFTPRPSTGNW